LWKRDDIGRSRTGWLVADKWLAGDKRFGHESTRQRGRRERWIVGGSGHRRSAQRIVGGRGIGPFFRRIVGGTEWQHFLGHRAIERSLERVVNGRP
jgi:hypothetical protein